MLTFNNDNKLKEELLEKLKHHQDLDTFIQGTWIDTKSGKVEGNGFKGCFYGCTMQTDINAIAEFSKCYNVDLWFSYLTENIFENLPDGEYQTFPLESIKRLKVGVDLNKIKSTWFQILLKDQQSKFTIKGSEQYLAIQQCIELFSVPFNEIEESAANSAESAARSAAWSAAESAANSAAWSAESAAWSAASAANSARSAAESAAWSARSAAESAESRSNYYKWMRDQLFVLLENL